MDRESPGSTTIWRSNVGSGKKRFCGSSDTDWTSALRRCSRRSLRPPATLHAIEIDGIFFGQIKRRDRILVDIDRRGERAAIIPFAQSEMVERFLFGIDDDLEQKILTFVEKSFDKLCQRYQQQNGVDLLSVGLDGNAYSISVSKVLERLKDRSRRETLDMVDFMPKQELAYTAEAFVTLTSMKRKVSAQQETVGGPIDVAIITKNEGFVWIKRKHYFDKELNASLASSGPPMLPTLAVATTVLFTRTSM